MNRRAFVQTVGASVLGASLAPPRFGRATKLTNVGLELYSVRNTMAHDPDGTLAAVRAMGYTQVELLWSFDNFGRTPQQIRAILDKEGLRAPSCHASESIIFVGWERSLEIAKLIGQDYIIVPSFSGDTSRTLDDWREWADRFNAAGAVARRHGIWLAFHNEPDHMKPIDGQIPYDVFVERTDPSVVRLQLDTGNMLIGGGDPFAYLARYKDRYWAFHLKDAVADKSHDTELGTGIFDFKKFLAQVPNVNDKPCYVEQEGPKDELASMRLNCQYLKGLEF